MSESPRPTAALAVLGPQPRRRWHARRRKGQHAKRLPPLHNEEANAKTEERSVPWTEERRQSTLVKAGALYGATVSPPPAAPQVPYAPYAPYGAPPTRQVRSYAASDRPAHQVDLGPQEPKLEQQAWPPMASVTESPTEQSADAKIPAEEPAEAKEEKASPLRDSNRQMTRDVQKDATVESGQDTVQNESDDGDDEDAVPFVVSALLEYAADAMSVSDEEGGSTCSAWSYDDCSLKPNLDDLLAKGHGPDRVGHDPEIPEFDDLLPKAHSLDDLLAQRNRRPRSHKPSPRTKLAPVDSTSDRRVPLTAR